MSISVLVLAGSRDGERDPLARMGNVSHKALLPIGNVPMIERVVQALESTPGIGRIWVSIETPECLSHLGKRVSLLEAAASPSESVARALAHIDTPCLVTTADHALLRPEWLEEFLRKSQASGADLTAGIALKETVQRDVPQTRRTYIRLSDACFSGCNLFWLGTDRALNVVTLWQKLQRYRKQPWRMAAMLGIGSIFQVMTRTFSMRRLAKRIRELTGAQICLVPLSDGRAAVDVDKPDDAALVARLLAGTQG